MQMLWEGPEVDTTDGPGGEGPPTCGPAQDRLAVSSRLYVGCHPAWVVFGGKTHMSPFGLSDSKCLAL